MTKEAIAKAPERRTKRTPVGRRNVLTVSGKDPDYVYRVVNDTGNRIQTFLDAGYVIEESKSVQVGDKRVENPTGEGSLAQMQVGGGQKAYLMKQRKEWYDEDQAAKAAHVLSTEEATRQKALDGTYGNFDIKRS